MKKINISVLLAAFLVAVFAFSFSLAFAKSEKAGNPSAGKSLTANQGSSAGIASSTNKDEIDSEDKDELGSQEHRSAAADFVQVLLQAADRDKGLGEQVRVIAREQERDEATTTDAIKKIENRSKVKTFLIGSDYKNLGALRSEMVKTRNRIKQLEGVLGKAKNAANADEIKSQIEALNKEQTKIEAFVKTQEGKFSLFGWLMKLFNK